jgi:hypothetical protein
MSMLNLYNNSLTGSIPTEVGNLVGMSMLNLYNNSLTGSISTEVCNMVSMKKLNLYNNFLTGTIPTVVRNMVSLSELKLNDNANLGPGLPCLSTSVTTLDYSNTNITCSYPSPDGGTTTCKTSNVPNTVCNSFPCGEGFVQSGDECEEFTLAFPTGQPSGQAT